MNEIGGTFKWSDKAKAYARAFREGDAVKVSGEWRKVKKYEGGGIQSDNFHAILNNYDTPVEYNPYCLNYDHDGKGNFAGVTNGFLESRVMTPYQITTLKDFEVQKGDKLVWLGESNEFLTFGKVYIATGVFLGCGISYVADDGLWRFLSPLAVKYWGVIPRYENVKEEKEMNEKTELVDEVEYSGKFKVGDRVKVIATAFQGSGSDIGKFGIASGISEKYKHFAPYLVEFDSGGEEHFNEAELELIQQKEKSAEQEALEYLLSREKDATRRILREEIAIWAKIHLEHGDYDDSRQATEILEKLEKGE